MPDPEKVATVVSEWVAKAENDLKTAYILRLAKGGPTDTVCFHAQQVVEKYLKALLTQLPHSEKRWAVFSTTYDFIPSLCAVVRIGVTLAVG
jgi:hypothetical protein